MTKSLLTASPAAVFGRGAWVRSGGLWVATALACVLWGETLWAQREPAIAPAPAGGARPANVVSGKPRQVLVEVFVKNECAQCTALDSFLAERQKRGDLRIKNYNVEQDPAALRRLHALCRRDGVPPGVPAVYSCGRLQTGFRDAQTSGPQFDQLVGFEVFVQDGCPHCLSAKRYLETLQARTPGLQITFRNLSREAGQLQRMQAIARQRGVGNPQVPFFSLYGQTLMGFDPTGATGRQLNDLVDQHFAPEPPPPSTPPLSSTPLNSTPAATERPAGSTTTTAPAKSGG
ncbi:MAG: hypothetical protein ACKOGA_06010 [Planctomycetaceae bacterium]